MSRCIGRRSFGRGSAGRGGAAARCCGRAAHVARAFVGAGRRAIVKSAAVFRAVGLFGVASVGLICTRDKKSRSAQQRRRQHDPMKKSFSDHFRYPHPQSGAVLP